jgi:serine/threonine-protein kinase
MALMPDGGGTTLAGRYRLLEPIGRGGMGTVWRATQLALSRDVAVKMLDVPQAMTSRLRTEALALAALHHPNIVGVIDFGEDAGRPFVAMELVEGETLEHMLAARGPLAPADAIAMAIPIFDALAYAHRRGVVHRDLKPANVLLDRSDGGLVPKLVDFGIALLASEPRATQAIAGTPAYMAPEQARGHAVDARADVWGAAAMLYEMLEGTPPFGDDESPAVLSRILLEPPRVAERTPASLASILLRALVKDPTLRTPNAAALVGELRAWKPEQAPISAFARTLASAEPAPPSLDALVRSRFGGS